MRPPKPPPLSGPAFAVTLAALGGALALVVGLEGRPRPHGQEVAQAIQRGIDRSHVPDPEAAEDDALTGSEDEAGYRWAERHGLDRLGGCPAYSPAFQEGCAAYIRDEAARDGY
jgi:hypothetical protein